MTDSTALMERTDDIIPAAAELKQMAWMAEQFLKSGLLPSAIKSPQAVLLIMEKGRELGIKPLYALSNIHVIDGKPTCSAELLKSLIYRDHGDNAIRVTSSTETGCTIRYKRRGWDSAETFTFDAEDAQRADLLNKPTWKKYPKAMFHARAVSAVARLAFADSIGGMYTPEELGAEVQISEDGEIVPAARAFHPAAAFARETWGPEEQPTEAEWEPQGEGTDAKAQQQHPMTADVAADHLERACKQLAIVRNKPGETWRQVLADLARFLGYGGRRVADFTPNEMTSLIDTARTQVKQLQNQATPDEQEAPF